MPSEIKLVQLRWLLGRALRLLDPAALEEPYWPTDPLQAWAKLRPTIEEILSHPGPRKAAGKWAGNASALRRALIAAGIARPQEVPDANWLGRILRAARASKDLGRVSIDFRRSNGGRIWTFRRKERAR